MADRLEEGPLADELLELQEARRATDDLQKWGGDPREFLDVQRYAEACEERFWSEAFKNPGCKRYSRILTELEFLGDVEGAAIFVRRHMGWEISNNPEWLLDEVEQLRSTMPLPKAVRTATGKYL